MLKGELAALLARLGQARAREAALTRAAAAEKRLKEVTADAKAGPAEASMLASLIAARSGHEAQDIARLIALITTGFSIFVTILMAGLMHQAVILIKQGLGLAGTTEPVTIEKAVEAAVPEEQEAEAAALPRKKKPLTPEQYIARFVSEHLKPGDGDVRASQVYEEFSTWWVCHAPGQPIPSQNAFGQELTKHGFNRSRRGGVSRYENVRLVPLGVN